MRTSVALLTLCLFYFCEADDPQLDHQAGEGNGKKTPNFEMTCVCTNITGSQSEKCELHVTAKDLEAKQKNTETQSGEGNPVASFKAQVKMTGENITCDTGAYDPATGMFTAPVKADYSFSFSGDYVTGGSTGWRGTRNRSRMAAVFDDTTENHSQTPTDGMTLQLEKGDQVQMKPPPTGMTRGIKIEITITIKF